MAHPDSSDPIPRSAWTALRLGQASAAAFVLSIFLGITVDSIGINGLLLPLVIPLAILAYLSARSVRRQMEGPSSPGFREATLGMNLGLAVLILSVLFILAVFLFFIQWLGK